jgi:hypothetical protein
LYKCEAQSGVPVSMVEKAYILVEKDATSSYKVYKLVENCAIGSVWKSIGATPTNDND